MLKITKTLKHKNKHHTFYIFRAREKQVITVNKINILPTKIAENFSSSFCFNKKSCILIPYNVTNLYPKNSIALPVTSNALVTAKNDSYFPNFLIIYFPYLSLAPQDGFEPPTGRLTAVCSATELLGNISGTDGQTWTGTTLSREILSLLCLPIPPRPHYL